VADDPIIFKTPMGDVVAPDQIADGSGLVGTFGESRAVVTRINGKLMAVSAICTHKGCTVGVNASEHTLDCPCHGSRYTLQGKNVKGPAVRPLAAIKIEERDGQIVLSE
jgi:Rieske Fe-S protein